MLDCSVGSRLSGFFRGSGSGIAGRGLSGGMVVICVADLLDGFFMAFRRAGVADWEREGLASGVEHGGIVVLCISDQ